MMDKIIIKDLKIYAYHGVNQEEKDNGQEFWLDITCYADLSAPSINDSIDSTVSYSKVIKLVRSMFTASKFNLLERGARVVADSILRTYPSVKKVTVLLKKPDAPIKADFSYVAVEITREQR